MSSFVVTVPHATSALPVALLRHEQCPVWGSLNNTHFALDRRAAVTAQAIGQYLGVTPVFGDVTRLAVDLNRGLNDSEVFPTHAGDVSVPFNAKLTAPNIAARRRHHRRFHERIAEDLAEKGKPYLVDVHSFARVGVNGESREVDIGICTPIPSPFAIELFFNLQMLAAITARKNGDRQLKIRWDEPYPGSHPGVYLTRRHADATRGVAVIEICDDIIPQTGEPIASLIATAISAAAAGLGSTEACACL